MSDTIKYQINRNLCVGLLLSVIISHYTEDEIKKDLFLKHIRKLLDSKNFPLSIGTKQEIQNANKEYMEKIAKLTTSPKKKKEIAHKFKIATLSIYKKDFIFQKHSDIVNKTFAAQEHNINEEYAVSASGMLFALLRKNEDVVKWYKFSKKKIAVYAKMDLKANTHTMRSSVFINALLDELDAQIEEHVKNASLDILNEKP